MIHFARGGCEMRAALPATLEAAEKFLIAFRWWGQAILNRAQSFASELLLREALTNAVVHGCRADPGKQVRCSLRLNGRRLLIAVEDDGEGFDWHAAARNSAAFAQCSGRGIELLRLYASGFRYVCRGNRVTILKRFQ